jgi:hypothetical protein
MTTDAKGRAVIVVGDVSRSGEHPAYPLYHLPRTGTGNRLRVVMGLTDLEYHNISKYNLCRTEWSMSAARESARCLTEMCPGGVYILLGVKVMKAFDVTGVFRVTHTPPFCVTLPHPSGANRVWNAPGTREWARTVLAEAAPGIPWGTNCPVSPKDEV